MINVIFNDFSYELLPKRKEIFEKYTKIIQWGRANPTRFIEDFFKIQLTDMQKYVLLSSWCPANCVWLMGRNSRKATSLSTKTYGKISDRGVAIEEKSVGELRIGDKIYDNTGKLTEVIHLNPIIFENVYEVESDLIRALDIFVVGCLSIVNVNEDIVLSLHCVLLSSIIDKYTEVTLISIGLTY